MGSGLLAYLRGRSFRKQRRLQHDATSAPEDPGRPWASHLRAVREALARNDLKEAMRALEIADTCSLASGCWEGMVEVGDTYLQLAETLRARKALIVRARQNYLAALYCARQQRSVDGVLRTAASFAGLGDRRSVDHCLLIAEGMAQSTSDAAQERVRTMRARIVAGH
jgi:hypothetical protein